MPTFSICIPTRERHATLKSAIQTVLAQSYRDFELIIQDNFSSQATTDVVRSFEDPRIVYSRSDRKLPMHENWEQALQRTNGDYVLFIGDDDALMPDGLERAREMIDHERPDAMFSPAHLYYWPDVSDAQRRNHLRLDYRGYFEWREAFLDAPPGATSSSYPARTPGTAFLDHEAMLRNIFTWSNSRLYISIYHGFVSQALVQRVKAANGGLYFLDPTPDFASMVVNLYYGSSILFSAKPFTMTGQSGRSNGGTAGDARRLREFVDIFAAEAGVTLKELSPTVFEPYPCPTALVAGCYETVKRKAFPGDDRFRIDWERFLITAAIETAQQPEEDRQAYRQWVLTSADRIGLDRTRLEFPLSSSGEPRSGVESDQPTSSWKRLSGVETDRFGRVHYIHLDGDELGLKTIADAVAIANSMAPVSTFPLRAEPVAAARGPEEIHGPGADANRPEEIYVPSATVQERDDLAPLIARQDQSLMHWVRERFPGAVAYYRKIRQSGN